MAYTDQINGVDVDRSYSRVTNLNGCRIPYVRSFEIIEGSDKYALKINTNKLIGTYPTISAALGALVGCFHSARCNDDSAIHQIETLISNGKGIIPSAGTLQTIIFYFTDMSSGTAVSSDSTGLEIIDSSKLSQLFIGTNPRLWHGSETGVSGPPYSFPSSTESAAYWSQYAVTAQVNSNPIVDLGDPVTGSALLNSLNTDTSIGFLVTGPSTLTYVITGAS